MQRTEKRKTLECVSRRLTLKDQAKNGDHMIRTSHLERAGKKCDHNVT